MFCHSLVVVLGVVSAWVVCLVGGRGWLLFDGWRLAGLMGVVCLCGWWLFGSRRLVPGVWLDGWLLAVWRVRCCWFLVGVAWMVVPVVDGVLAGCRRGWSCWLGGVFLGLGCAVGWFLVAGGWRGSCRGSRFFWLAGL